MTIDRPTVMITGATDGLGRALAHRLAADGTRLVLHGRDPGKLRHTAAELRRRHDCPPPATVCADLSELAQVRRLARDVASATDRLDALVNNAGVGFGGAGERHRQLSADGHELRFAVNHLAGFDLTLRLLHLLRRAPHARIVNVASIGQHPIDFADVMLEHGYTAVRAYRQSKLAQIIAGLELAERLRGEPITVNSLHPATYMPTKMVLAGLGHSVDTLEAGTAATWRLIRLPELAGTTGRFFDRTTEARAHPTAYQQDVRTRLWRLSIDLTTAPSL
ncbi:SDR family NAD(P)-dependent oxidoreductase [Dactylosporangium sp. NPDC050588]|uniref:SDR family NAD(P)-dependent oxidoreductase n=1 Tax=Dactylosporangium sp. NPDC050588 TaxID=3157211 RepID=UPI0033D0892F